MIKPVFIKEITDCAIPEIAIPKMNLSVIANIIAITIKLNIAITKSVNQLPAMPTIYLEAD